LIELMLALGALAVLLSIALPAYTAQRNKARVRTAGQQIAMMQMAIQAHRNDTGSYPATLAAAGLGSPKDPWGRAYQYYNVQANGTGGARKDKALNPVNTDYDLYSLGADGLSARQLDSKDSLDDIVRANNGGFVGLSSEF
jgi:general secretion pathway protein G